MEQNLESKIPDVKLDNDFLVASAANSTSFERLKLAYHYSTSKFAPLQPIVERCYPHLDKTAEQIKEFMANNNHTTSAEVKVVLKIPKCIHKPLTANVNQSDCLLPVAATTSGEFKSDGHGGKVECLKMDIDNVDHQKQTIPPPVDEKRIPIISDLEFDLAKNESIFPCCTFDEGLTPEAINQQLFPNEPDHQDDDIPFDSDDLCDIFNFDYVDENK